MGSILKTLARSWAQLVHALRIEQNSLSLASLCLGRPFRWRRRRRIPPALRNPQKFPVAAFPPRRAQSVASLHLDLLVASSLSFVTNTIADSISPSRPPLSVADESLAFFHSQTTPEMAP